MREVVPVTFPVDCDRGREESVGNTYTASGDFLREAANVLKRKAFKGMARTLLAKAVSQLDWPVLTRPHR